MTIPCERFQEEGLELLERGEPLDDHFRHCADCVASASAYERLKKNLAAVPAEAAPSGWERAVWARIERNDARRRIQRLAPAFGAMAAAVLVVVAWNLGGDSTDIGVEVRRTGEVARGLAAKPDDVLAFTARTGSKQHAEFRLYRDGALVLRCSDQPPCSREGKVLSVQHAISQLGRYEPVLLLSDAPIPSALQSHAGNPSGRQEDLAAAARLDVTIVTSPGIDAY